MVEACERRILEFPLDMDAREVAKELKREGWYAWASNYESIVFRIKRVRAKAGSDKESSLPSLALRNANLWLFARLRTRYIESRDLVLADEL